MYQPGWYHSKYSVATCPDSNYFNFSFCVGKYLFKENAKKMVLIDCFGVLRPSQQRGHVEPVS